MAEICISVIIPIYNMEHLLSKCVDSILNQTYRCIDVILVDDGSTDNSLTICNDYAKIDSRVKVVQKQNGGVSSARNAGIDVATGDYVHFVDPDDWIELNTYEILVHYLLGNRSDILRFNANRKGEILNELPFEGIYENERFENEIVLPMIGSEKFGGMFILGVLWIHLFNRELIERNKIRFNTELMRCEDRLFTTTAMLFAHSMTFVKDCLYHYEVYDNSLSNRYDPNRWKQESLYLEKLKELFRKNKNDTFVKEANLRVANDCVLRVVTSVNQEFFSNNNNSFQKKYINLQKILNDPQTIDALKKMQSEKLGLKGRLTIMMIKNRLVSMLCIFNTIILFKNKLIPNG